MRLNKYIAFYTGLSRRHADGLVKSGKVQVNGRPALMGQEISEDDKVIVNGLEVQPKNKITTIMLNKPAGCVVSRNGQGNKTIYELLPEELHSLKPVGRLDKDSSGLLLLTNDGDLANELTHPSRQKEKIYEVELNRELKPEDKAKTEQGIKLKDGLSQLKLKGAGKNWRITMHEGRNRQIRRTFAALDYKVIRLHRTRFGSHILDDLQIGNWKNI